MKAWFKKLNCCVIIPTYNNSGTLKKVIEEVLQYTDDLIVVNDGATDNTEEVLLAMQDSIQVLRHAKNAGKGMALRNGFSYALQKGYDYVITMDSDAQHFASDLPLFLTELENHPDSLVIGARNMNQENVTGKSSFGNKFSNFWFWVETGNKLSDTQSGYRLYPIRKMEGTGYLSSLFEFEVEVIVKASWQGIPVKNIPIQVHYEPGIKRITHFRPFRDFSRISVLNTYLVTLALLYYIPLRFFKSLTRENIRNFINKNFFDRNEPIHIKAFSIAFGIFMGIFPIMGFQLLVGIPLAHLMRLNKAIFVTAAHISIPPMIPVLVFGSYKLGGLFLDNPKNNLLFSEGLTMEMVQENFVQYVVGAVALSIIMAVISGMISYGYFYIARSRRLALEPAPVE